MTIEELRAVLVPFALALRAEFDGPTQRAYARTLEDIPAPLLHAAVQRAEREGDLRFMPSAPEWRGRCEAERLRVLALHPYEACTDCHGVGTVKTSPLGVIPPTYGPCACRRRYLERMADMGIPAQPVAKVAIEPQATLNPPAPSLDELPPAISDRIRQLADGRRM